MELRCISLVKKVIEINHFWMLYALCNKVHKIRTCKHHGTRFIDHSIVKKLFDVNHF
jgi:hypothetical protein